MGVGGGARSTAGGGRRGWGQPLAAGEGAPRKEASGAEQRRMREHSCVDRVERLLAELWCEKDGGGKAAQNGRRQPLREARPLRTRACLSVTHAHRTCTQRGEEL